MQWPMSLALAGALVFQFGCDPNTSGKVYATRFGGRSDVPAPRARYDRLMTEACGAEPSRGGSSLVRHPYVQQVQDDSAQLMWTSTSPEPHEVMLHGPDGALAGALAATRVSELEPTALLRDAHQHRVQLSGLEPDRYYCYTVLDADGNEVAADGLRTAPAEGSEAAVRFVAFGDSGHGGDDQRAVFNRIQTVPFDLALITGDVAYPSGTLRQFEDHFFAIYRPMLGSFPVFPVLGNHDYGTADGAPFLEVFALPENGRPAGAERWYSFDYGDVHFVALDTQRIGEAQLEWLDADLANNELPWTIVFMHKSPYASGAHGSSEEVRRRISPLLEFHDVPLVLAGHDHDYERTRPIRGVTYVVTGGGGRGTRAVGSSWFTEFSHDVLHFVHVTIEGESLRLHAIDAAGQEFDFVQITRPSN